MDQIKPNAKEPKIKHGHARRGSQSREYNAWLNAKKRCFNPTNPKYPHYGGRGITMCPEWRHDFSAFLSDMGLCPKGMSLDRIDNHGNYEPSNCRWADRRQQDRNKRNNRFIEFEGERKVHADWARELGVDKSALRRKLECGSSLQDLFGSSRALQVATNEVAMGEAYT